MFFPDAGISNYNDAITDLADYGTHIAPSIANWKIPLWICQQQVSQWDFLFSVDKSCRRQKASGIIIEPDRIGALGIHDGNSWWEFVASITTASQIKFCCCGAIRIQKIDFYMERSTRGPESNHVFIGLCNGYRFYSCLDFTQNLGKTRTSLDIAVKKW